MESCKWIGCKKGSSHQAVEDLTSDDAFCWVNDAAFRFVPSAPNLAIDFAWEADETVTITGMPPSPFCPFLAWLMASDDAEPLASYSQCPIQCF